jgi:hypothetical protein
VIAPSSACWAIAWMWNIASSSECRVGLMFGQGAIVLGSALWDVTMGLMEIHGI